MLFSEIICWICSLAIAIKILLFDKNCHIWILTKKEPFFSKKTFPCCYPEAVLSGFAGLMLFKPPFFCRLFFFQITLIRFINLPISIFCEHGAEHSVRNSLLFRLPCNRVDFLISVQHVYSKLYVFSWSMECGTLLQSTNLPSDLPAHSIIFFFIWRQFLQPLFQYFYLLCSVHINSILSEILPFMTQSSRSHHISNSLLIP